MNFGLIIIGDEILSGKRQDKHLPKLVELLGARGLALAWARTAACNQGVTASACMRPTAARTRFTGRGWATAA